MFTWYQQMWKMITQSLDYICLMPRYHEKLTFIQSKPNVLKGGGNWGVILFDDSFLRMRVISSWTVVAFKLNPSKSSRRTIFRIFLCWNDLISLMTNLTTWAILPCLTDVKAQVYLKSGQCTSWMKKQLKIPQNWQIIRKQWGGCFLQKIL